MNQARQRLGAAIAVSELELLTVVRTEAKTRERHVEGYRQSLRAEMKSRLIEEGR